MAALKEWGIVCRALEQGRQVILLRKGGILEYKQGFEIKHDSFWLYPTLEHQSKDFIQPDYLEEMGDIFTGNDAQKISKYVIIKSYANVERIYEIENKSLLSMLSRYHIWNEKYVHMRMDYNPTKPLNALLLRVYKLAQPVKFEIAPEWSGCKSWIDIDIPEYTRFENARDINKLESLKPVIIDSEFRNITDEIDEVLK
ncbi:MAG: DUF1802 family protein [Thermoproteota archaeon]|nr:DUF1802 family protein [Thermoproteota archaeon]